MSDKIKAAHKAANDALASINRSRKNVDKETMTLLCTVEYIDFLEKQLFIISELTKEIK